MAVDWDRIVTKDYLDAKLGKLEARMEARFSEIHRTMARLGVAMVIALAGSPVIAALAERYVPALP